MLPGDYGIGVVADCSVRRAPCVEKRGVGRLVSTHVVRAQIFDQGEILESGTQFIWHWHVELGLIGMVEVSELDGCCRTLGGGAEHVQRGVDPVSCCAQKHYNVERGVLGRVELGRRAFESIRFCEMFAYLHGGRRGLEAKGYFAKPSSSITRFRSSYCTFR